MSVVKRMKIQTQAIITLHCEQCDREMYFIDWRGETMNRYECPSCYEVVKLEETYPLTRPATEAETDIVGLLSVGAKEEIWWPVRDTGGRTITWDADYIVTEGGTKIVISADGVPEDIEIDLSPRAVCEHISMDNPKSPKE